MNTAQRVLELTEHDFSKAKTYVLTAPSDAIKESRLIVGHNTVIVTFDDDSQIVFDFKAATVVEVVSDE